MSQEQVKAPDFKLLGDDGKHYSLNDFQGKKLVLYFYPKDSTSGWTTEAKDFSALYQQFADAQTVIVGVSPDSISSHIKFKEKQDISFLLLSDPEKKIAAEYGAYGEKNLYGKKSMGIIRSTFLIQNGIIVKAWKKVTVNGHAQSVLKAIQS